jgi:gliding motility-associated-like protein
LFGIRELTFFRVYNRWGQLLYQTNSAHQGWNGLLNGKKVGNEAVVWIAEGIGMDGKRYTRKGTSLCIR